MIKGLINLNYFKMKKSILNLGKALNKIEQKEINGGFNIPVICRVFCPAGCHCSGHLNDECAKDSDGSFCYAL